MKMGVIHATATTMTLAKSKINDKVWSVSLQSNGRSSFRNAEGTV